MSDSDFRVINRFWKPNEGVLKMVEGTCVTKGYKRILEIGPGFVPFSLATDFIGCNEKMKPEDYVDIDIDKDLFPYEADTFDFIYCRHVLEDIQNPDFALREITRVCRGGGYIETPSPLIEVTKGVDASPLTDKYCGYIHHRYLVWSSIERNEIYFLPKYSCILDHIFEFEEEQKPVLYQYINNFPVYWNNYFVFSLQPKVIMYKNGVNFNIGSNGSMVQEYIALVRKAIWESIENTNYFIISYKQ